MVTEWFSTDRFKQFHGVDSSDPDAFYKMLARLCPQHGGPPAERLSRLPRV